MLIEKYNVKGKHILNSQYASVYLDITTWCTEIRLKRKLTMIHCILKTINSPL